MFGLRAFLAAGCEAGAVEQPPATNSRFAALTLSIVRPGEGLVRGESKARVGSNRDDVAGVT